MTNIDAIKGFFEKDGGRTVSMAELKALSKEERTELAILCGAALGVEVAGSATASA